MDLDVVLVTHSGSLDDDLASEAVVIADGGPPRNASGWKGSAPGGHHRSGTLSFPGTKQAPAVIELRIQRPGRRLGAQLPVADALIVGATGECGCNAAIFNTKACLFMLLWWVLIILGIVVLVRWLFGARHGGSPSENRALAILRERYARGEIEKNEYDARKNDLSA